MAGDGAWDVDAPLLQQYLAGAERRCGPVIVMYDNGLTSFEQQGRGVRATTFPRGAGSCVTRVYVRDAAASWALTQAV